MVHVAWAVGILQVSLLNGLCVVMLFAMQSREHLQIVQKRSKEDEFKNALPTFKDQGYFILFMTAFSSFGCISNISDDDVALSF